MKRFVIAIAGFFCFMSSWQIYAANEVQVISNPLSDTRTLSADKLKRIYTMKLKIWPNGMPVKVFALPSSNQIHQTFVKELLNSNTYQLDRVWNRLAFSGRGSSPIVVGNIEELLQKVQTTPGAIGYVPVGTRMQKVLPIQVSQ
ncbi:hypothetical protein THMIRHAM_06650 [Thiomicrorhabdus immobilis]|uniref:PBP domain-containing protein n=1 Tax=Thiomicrorhabdus immobilis TaxID=2791037 RepID=A0ABN6CYC2_9GAMM|nr:hypothetical protein [Thiomicrorhabdus immobilis]BCN92880.1 hypothetical protein THMIRHAM_06650 [Thiomicrorhabdus immobilis]